MKYMLGHARHCWKSLSKCPRIPFVNWYELYYGGQFRDAVVTRDLVHPGGALDPSLGLNDDLDAFADF